MSERFESPPTETAASKGKSEAAAAAVPESPDFEKREEYQRIMDDALAKYYTLDRPDEPLATYVSEAREDILQARQALAAARAEGEAFERFFCKEMEQESSSHRLFEETCFLRMIATPACIETVGKILDREEIWNDADSSLAGRLIETLATTSSPEAPEILDEFITNLRRPEYCRDDAYDNLIPSAVAAIRHIGGEESDALLRKYMKDNNPRMRDALEESMWRENSLRSIAKQRERKINLRPAPLSEVASSHEEDYYDEDYYGEDYDDDYYFEDDKDLTLEEGIFQDRLEDIEDYRVNVLGFDERNLNPIIDFYLLRTYRGQDLRSLSEEEQANIKQKVEQLTKRHGLLEKELDPAEHFVDVGVEVKVHPERAPLATSLEVAEVKEAGMPVKDAVDYAGYYEYYPGPVNYYLTLSREVQELVKEELIPTGAEAIRGRAEELGGVEQRGHSLHITLGGIERAPAANVLTNALISTTWASSRERLLAAYYGSAHWTWKQGGAVSERPPQKLEGSKLVAIEMRPFEIKSLSGFDRTMRTAFYLGTALRSFQKVEEGGSEPDVLDRDLARIWGNFEKEVAQIFVQEGLHPPERDYDRPAYERLAKAIDDVDGKPSKFTRKIRAACIRTRGKAAKATRDYYEGELTPER